MESQTPVDPREPVVLTRPASTRTLMAPPLKMPLVPSTSPWGARPRGLHAGGTDETRVNAEPECLRTHATTQFIDPYIHKHKRAHLTTYLHMCTPTDPNPCPSRATTGSIPGVRRSAKHERMLDSWRHTNGVAPFKPFSASHDATGGCPTPVQYANASRSCTLTRTSPHKRHANLLRVSAVRARDHYNE